MDAPRKYELEIIKDEIKNFFKNGQRKIIE
jgi:hypothetical protein